MGKRVPKCYLCGESGVRSDQYDAYYCVECGIWLERECGDDLCGYCRRRPEVPPRDWDRG